MAFNVDEQKFSETASSLLKASSSISTEALSETAKILGAMRGENEMVDNCIDQLLNFEEAYNSVFCPSIKAVLNEMANIEEFKSVLAKATASMSTVKVLQEEVHVNAVELPSGV